MKPQFTFGLVVLLALGACKSSTGPTINIVSNAPTITGFSPDTAWTFKTITIYGTNFGYDPQDVPVRIDTAIAQVTYVADTIMKVIVPEYARTGPIHVTKLKMTATSQKQVVVQYTFSPHYLYAYSATGVIFDSAAPGASLSILGTGILNHHGPVKIVANGISYPIDSLLEDRIVTHVPPNGSSGRISVADDNGLHDCGMLYVSRYMPWRTLTVIWDNYTVTESHNRFGYINGPAHGIDSSWNTQATYNGQFTWDISGNQFSRTERGLTLYLPLTLNSSIYAYLLWDTITPSLSADFRSSQYASNSALHSLDTMWYVPSVVPVGPSAMPVDMDRELDLSNLRMQIVEDSTDQTGLVKWHEETNSTTRSGTFRLRFSK